MEPVDPGLEVRSDSRQGNGGKTHDSERLADGAGPEEFSSYRSPVYRPNLHLLATPARKRPPGAAGREGQISSSRVVQRAAEEGLRQDCGTRQGPLGEWIPRPSRGQF